MKRSTRKLLWCGVAAGAAPLILLGGYIAAIQANNNFDVVVADQIYRSAQPSASDIARYSAQNHIASIINLRGADQGAPWYEQELSASNAAGLKHYDFAMVASQSLTQQEAADLLALLEKAEKPVLIHCQWGADRTGLAAALYLAAIAKQGEAAAEGQLSLRYGHFSVPVIGAAYAMDETFEALEPWLGFFDS